MVMLFKDPAPVAIREFPLLESCGTSGIRRESSTYWSQGVFSGSEYEWKLHAQGLRRNLMVTARENFNIR